MQEITLISRLPELTIGLSGEIHAQNADEFYEEVLAAYTQEKADLVFECRKLEFIDSTTLGTFVKLCKTVKADGHRMVLRGLQPRLKRLFVICALDALMEIEE